MADIQPQLKTRLRALYSYSYEDDSGQQIAMDEGEEFFLIAKTNGMWWHVMKTGGNNQPIYVPANYVEEISGQSPSRDDSEDDDNAFDDNLPPGSPGYSRSQMICVKSNSPYQQKDPNRLSTFGGSQAQGQPSSASGSSRGDPDSDPGLLTPDEDGQDEVNVRRRDIRRTLSASDSSLPQYANLDDYRQAAGISLPSSKQAPSDQSHEYMNLADIQARIHASPEPPPPPKPGKSTPIKKLPDGWEMHIDPSKNRPFYYNSLTTETSWKPPRYSVRREDGDGPNIVSPGSNHETTEQRTSNGSAFGLDAAGKPLPKGWVIEIRDKGEKFYVNTATNERWISSIDAAGKTYYYKQNSSDSVRELTEVEPQRHNSVDIAIGALEEVRSRIPPTKPVDRQSRARSMMAFTSELNMSLMKSRTAPSKLPVSPVKEGQETSFKKELEDLLQIPGPEGTVSLVVKPTDKKGILNRSKIMEAGKRVNKKWSQSYVVLTGQSLLLYKDHKAAQKSPVGKPETVIDMSTAEVEWGNKETSSKKNVLQVSSDGNVYLLQADDGTKIQEWNLALKRSQEFASQLAEKLPPLAEQSKPPSQTPPPAGKMKRSKSTKMKADEPSKIKIREKLRNFLTRRPTRDLLQEKGIIREQVFGSAISEICERENSTIPRFVMDCIAEIDSRGLAVDGIYRLCGNLAQVQNLRFEVDKNSYDLSDANKWEIHVLTGALKLFFRELKEPLFPFEFYDKFKHAIMVNEKSRKLQAIKDLVRVLPKANHDTCKLLFRHLRDVMTHSQQNRMQAQNIAIVFGPTLLWPKDEAPNMAVSTVFQNQIVEFILLEYDAIFS